MNTFVWKVSPAEAFDLSAIEQQIQQAARRAADLLRQRLEEAAKRDAPWTDRTGAARRELFAAAEEVSNDLIVVYLSHGPEVEYGRYLETRWQEKYAVILPTLQAHAADIWKLIARELS